MKKISKVEPVAIEAPRGWYAGSNSEYLNIAGPLLTRDEAIAAGRADRCGDPFYICEAMLHTWSAPSADSVMDSWIEGHDELWFDASFDGFDGPADADVCAEEDLQTVLNEWFERHKAMLPSSNAFSSVWNGEWIDKPDPVETTTPDGENTP